MGNPFRPTYRALSEAQQEHISELKCKAEELHNMMATVLYEGDSPDKGRYMALARTSLEESVMWAVKGLTG